MTCSLPQQCLLIVRGEKTRQLCGLCAEAAPKCSAAVSPSFLFSAKLEQVLQQLHCKRDTCEKKDSFSILWGFLFFHLLPAQGRIYDWTGKPNRGQEQSSNSLTHIAVKVICNTDVNHQEVVR